MSFFSEVLIFCGLTPFSPVVWLLLGLFSFFSGVYSVFLYSSPSQGLSLYNNFIFINSKVLLFCFALLFFPTIFPFLFFIS